MSRCFSSEEKDNMFLEGAGVRVDQEQKCVATQDHKLPHGAGTLGLWWELRVKSTKIGRERSRQ